MNKKANFNKALRLCVQYSKKEVNKSTKKKKERKLSVYITKLKVIKKQRPIYCAADQDSERFTIL